MATCPVYPPGVLQTFTIPDPTSLDGFGELEITLIPSQGVTGINHISAEGINAFKEMLYEIDEEYRREIQTEMDSTSTLMESIRIRDEMIWQDNAIAVRAARVPSLWFTLGCEYGLPAPWDIRCALDDAEEDSDYEEWINSKQYVKSLEEYNRHKLLAFEKGRSPDWVGECTEDKATTTAEKCVLYNTFLLDRFKLDAVVRTEFPNQQGDKGYAKASSPYGDIYIPNKFNGYIGLPGDPITLTVALQDVGGGGRKANGYRFTCIYIH
jgi:hypothetical protein